MPTNKNNKQTTSANQASKNMKRRCNSAPPAPGRRRHPLLEDHYHVAVIDPATTTIDKKTGKRIIQRNGGRPRMVVLPGVPGKKRIGLAMYTISLI